MSYTPPNAPPSEQVKAEFNWKRQRLFDRYMCFVLFSTCYESPVATVTKVERKRTTKR